MIAVESSGFSGREMVGIFAQFDQVCQGMLGAKTLREFAESFDRSMSVDPRCTFLFLRKHHAKIPEDHMYFAQRHFKISIMQDQGQPANHGASIRRLDHGGG